MLEFGGHQVTRIESAEAGLNGRRPTRPRRHHSGHADAGHGRARVSAAAAQRPGLERLPVGVITGDYFLSEPVLQELAALGATVRYKPVRIDDLAALTDQLLGPNAGADPEPA